MSDQTFEFVYLSRHVRFSSDFGGYGLGGKRLGNIGALVMILMTGDDLG